MKNWKKLISAGLALGLVLTSVPQSTSVVYAQENGTLQNVTFEQEQEAVQNAPITVQKVNGLSKDFVNGVDVSSYLSLVESGAKYYDEKGDETDLFDLLENAGVNYVRLRVWNDPFPWDEDGNYKYVGADGTTEYKAAAVTQAGISVNGVQQYCLVDDPDTQVYREVYGAGVCDVATAAIIGKKATDHHMKVLIDFHYSDFWADPKKQRVPKQWEGMSLEEKTSALSEFTEESLNTLLDAGVDVGMVQVGNEINNGMAGETDEANVYQLLKAGSAAVRIRLCKCRTYNDIPANHNTSYTNHKEQQAFWHRHYFLCLCRFNLFTLQLPAFFSCFQCHTNHGSDKYGKKHQKYSTVKTSQFHSHTTEYHKQQRCKHGIWEITFQCSFLYGNRSHYGTKTDDHHHIKNIRPDHITDCQRILMLDCCNNGNRSLRK